MRNSIVLSLLFIAATRAANPAIAADQPGIQQFAQLNTQIQVQMDYLLYLPKDYDSQE